ncbi:MAG: ferritin-like domain-containing protein, partial [Gammaproteobacteria bacterium]|nr:ferritin-like domain-containing protein [Gammaproteobacteria bacterium]
MSAIANNLFARARAALLLTDAEAKCQAANALRQDWQAGKLDLVPIELADVAEAGRPEQTRQVQPRHLAKRGIQSPEGRAALIHAITHIEFSAINLALDAVFRFRQLPSDYYADWLQVAAEEAEHFSLLRQRLRELGYDYGDFPVHLGLWQAAMATRADPLARMALVPRLLEARGLDVTPGMMERLRQVKDEATVAILQVILRDEIGHVAAGTRWFHYLCQERGLEPEAAYFD